MEGCHASVAKPGTRGTTGVSRTRGDCSRCFRGAIRLAPLAAEHPGKPLPARRLELIADPTKMKTQTPARRSGPTHRRSGLRLLRRAGSSQVFQRGKSWQMRRHHLLKQHLGAKSMNDNGGEFERCHVRPGCGQYPRTSIRRSFPVLVRASTDRATRRAPRPRPPRTLPAIAATTRAASIWPSPIGFREASPRKRGPN